jgi:hypothetical protein
MFDTILKHDYSQITIGSFFKIVSDYGIRVQENKSSCTELPVIYVPDNCVKPVKNNIDTLTKVKKVLKPGPWSNEIQELEKFFSSVQLPESIKLNTCSIITDINLFIKSELFILKAQNGKPRYIPDLERLRLLKIKLN